jgi:hypothetical protein
MVIHFQSLRDFKKAVGVIPCPAKQKVDPWELSQTLPEQKTKLWELSHDLPERKVGLWELSH